MPRKIAALALLLAMSVNAAGQSQDVKEYNLGVEAFQSKNYTAARQHWTQAVAQGIPSAYNNLGFLLYNGLGGEENAMRAVALWRDAAMSGHPESQWHLASAYEEGKGTVRTGIEAYAWYRCAEAGYRARGKFDTDDSEIARDIIVSAPRVLAALPEAQRKLANELAALYIKLYATAETED